MTEPTMRSLYYLDVRSCLQKPVLRIELLREHKCLVNVVGVGIVACKFVL